jgi:hypothetical protein
MCYELCMLGRILCLSVMGGIIACGAIDEPAPSVPLVQHISYNTSNTTNVYGAAPLVLAPAPQPAPFYGSQVDSTPASPPAPQVEAQVGAPAAEAVPTRDPQTTGVPVCDAYLARLEICTRRMLSSQGEPMQRRFQESFDLMRRNWRRAAQTGVGRESLVDSCETSLRMYNESMKGHCG